MSYVQSLYAELVHTAQRRVVSRWMCRKERKERNGRCYVNEQGLIV